MRKTMKSLRLALVACIVATCALVGPVPTARATKECLGSNTHAYQGDCVFMRVYTAYDGRIIVQYWGNQDFDFYQLRWSRPARTRLSSPAHRSPDGEARHGSPVVG